MIESGGLMADLNKRAKSATRSYRVFDGRLLARDGDCHD